MGSNQNNILKKVLHYSAMRGHARANINNLINKIENDEDFIKKDNFEKIISITNDLNDEYAYFNSLKNKKLNSNLHKKILLNLESHNILINDTYSRLDNYVSNKSQDKINSLSVSQLQNIYGGKQKIDETIKNITDQSEANYIGQRRVNMMTNNNFRLLYKLLGFIIFTILIFVMVLLKYNTSI